MRLSTYVQLTRALGDLPVTAADIDGIGRLIDGGADLQAVLGKRSGALTPIALLGIWRAHRRYRVHQSYLESVARRRHKEGQHVIVPALLKQTVARHEVAVLERAEALAPPGRASEHRRRDSIKSALSLWKVCLAIVRKQAKLSVEMDTDRPDLVEAYGDFVGTTCLKDIPAHRWLATRRGERVGALRLSFDLPIDQMKAQVDARAVNLATVAGGRNPNALLEALVLTDLEEWAVSLKDDEAQFLAIRSAGNTYLGMLSAAPANHPIVAGISVPDKGPLGVAIVLRGGRMVDSGVADDRNDPARAVEKLIGGHPVEAVVLPAAGQRHSVLDALTQRFANLAVIRVDGRGMRSARASISQGDSVPVKSALVLARRALRPLDAWLSVDPVELGLAEYQTELDADALKSALSDMQALARAKVKPSELTRGRPTGGRSAVRGPSKPLNPMLKSVDDLRPGMEVNGVVTNITQFGAFVNIGLAHEGLVHVSELADHFVNDPNEVVTVGQTVKARVLGIDRGRRRISLSMRPERQSAGPRPEAYADRTDGPRKKGVLLDDIPGRRGGRRGGGGGPGGFGNRPPSNISRAQALADLERLFKK